MWTEQQQQAIDSRNNTLVSAGAGSGKTAVLTERISQLLNEKSITISNLLVLTFTNAAAASMKQKVQKVLLKNGDTHNLALLDTADITTFDAFALSLCERYHIQLKLKPKVKVLSEELLKTLSIQYLQTIFDNYYEVNDKRFMNLIKAFVLDDDKPLQNKILAIKAAIDLLPDETAVLQNYDHFYSQTKIKTALEEEINQIKANHQTKLEQLLDFNQFNEFVTSVKAGILEDGFNYQPPRSPKGADEQVKQWLQQVREVISEGNQDVALRSEDLEAEADLVSSHIDIICEIILELNRQLTEFMFEHNCFSFNAIAKLAIELLKNNSDIVDELKVQYRYIMIDEYQDTSDLQEKFMSYLENDNVFMVGDIKQSIYRFRNANPIIFKKKYARYEHGMGGKKIDLLDNFRSREEVISGINSVFNQLMTIEQGGANYKQSHQMKASNQLFIKFNNWLDELTHGKKSLNTLKLLEYDKQQFDEVNIMIQDIQTKLDTNYQVYDAQLGQMRPVQLSDFAIITPDSTSHAKVYQQLSDVGLFVDVVGNTPVRFHPVFLTVYNLVMAVVHFQSSSSQRMLHLCGIARSYVGHVRDDQLVKMTLDPRGRLFPFYELLQEIHQSSTIYSVAQVVDTLLTKFGCYRQSATLNDVNAAFTILNHLQKMANEFSDMALSLQDFSQLLTYIYEGKISMMLPKPVQKGEAITLINIHKSKGLEYKICYFPFLDKPFNKKDVRSPFLFDTQLGFVLPLVQNRFVRQSLLKKIVVKKIEREELSEKIRLFYVALTRAQEEIILLYPQTEKTRPFENSFAGFLDYVKQFDLDDVWERQVISTVHVKTLLRDRPIPKLNKPFAFKSGVELDHRLKVKTKISKATDELLTSEVVEVMHLGTQLHEILEFFDLKNPDYQLVPKRFVPYIQGFVECGLDFEGAKIYHEFEFVDENQHGIIDLILEYEDEIKVIDFKTGNISDEAYVKQLSVYQAKIKQMSDKPIRTYLYSLMRKKLVELTKNID